MSDRRFYGLLAAIVVVFAGIRILYLFQLIETPILRLILLDSEFYYQWATRLFEGYGHPKGPFWVGPGYPIVLSAFFTLIGRAAAAPIVVLQILLSTGTVVLMSLISRRLFGTTTALVTAAIAALYAPWIYYDGAILSATVILFFNAVALYLLIVRANVHEVLSGDRVPDKPWIWLAAGFFVSVSALARPTPLIFAGLLVLAVLWIHRTRGWLSIALFFAAVAVVQSPISIRNVQNQGSAIFSTASGGVNFFIGNRSGATGKYDEMDFVLSYDVMRESEAYRLEAATRLGHNITLTEASQYWADQALEDIFRNTGDWVRALGKKLWYTLRNEEIANNFSFAGTEGLVDLLKWMPLRWGMVLGFALAGFFALWKNRRSLRVFGLYLLAYLLTCLIFFSSSEYRFPMILVLLPLAAVFFVEITRMLRDKQHGRLAAACGVYFVVAGFTNFPSAEMNYIVKPTTDYCNLGSKAGAVQQFEESLSYYARALTVEPTSRKAHEGMAKSLWVLKNYDEARIEYDLAGVEPPDSVSGSPADEVLAVVQKYVDAHDNQGGLDYLNSKIPADASAPVEVWIARATLEKNLGHFMNAGAAMLGASYRDPISPEWPFQAAEYFLDAANVRMADSLYREAIRRHPDYIPAYLELGFMSLELGDAGVAQEQLAELRKRSIADSALRAKVDTLAMEVRKIVGED